MVAVAAVAVAQALMVQVPVVVGLLYEEEVCLVLMEI